MNDENPFADPEDMMDIGGGSSMQPGEVSFRSFQPPEWVSVRSFQPLLPITIGGGSSSSSSSTQPVELPLLNLHPVVTVHPLQPSHTSEFQNVEPNNHIEQSEAERVLRGESTSMSVPQAFKEYTENWILSQTERRLITKKLWTRKKQTPGSKHMVFKSINVDNMKKFLDGSLKVGNNKKYIDLSRRKNPMPLPTFILNPNKRVPHISSHTLNVGMVDYERLVRLYFIFLNYCFLTPRLTFLFLFQFYSLYVTKYMD